MEAKLERRGNIVVVHLSGRIDYEAADRFRDTCLNLLKKEKVVFNLEKLNFVGSSGITPFVETMTTLSLQTEGAVKFCRVGSEFRKVFESGALKNAEIYESPEMATYSFDAYPLGQRNIEFVEPEQQQVTEAAFQPAIDKDIDIKD